MIKFIGGVALAMWAGAAWAADQPVYAPAPKWVAPAQPLSTPPKDDGQPIQVLLLDNQAHFSADADEAYSETVMRVQTPQGLQAVGNISREWDPDKDVLTVHKLHILRGDKVIDVLAGGKAFTVLRRESNLELSMLDGRLTATIQLEGLQVGDVVDFAATLKHHDPSAPVRSEQLFAEWPGLTVGRMRMRGVWSKDKVVRWRETEGLAAPKLTTTTDGVEFVIDMTQVKAPKAPKYAPARYSAIGQLQLSEYASWNQVSSTMAPLYAKAARLAPNSPLQAEVARIKAQSKDPAVRAAAALKLVQDQVRYVFLGMNLGGYVPAEADLTWARRFGDCKGKTTLLLALLRELDIDARPALVSTRFGDGLDARLPSMILFDHVIARVEIGGKVYWLDGTRTGDRGLADLQVPPFKWALPLSLPGGGLEQLVQKPFDQPNEVVSLRLDASQGLEAPAPAHAEIIMRGDAAIALNQLTKSVSKDDLDKFSRQFWTKQYDWITIKAVSAAYDDATGEARMSMDGVANMNWRTDESGLGKIYEVDGATLGGSLDYVREADTQQDAPYAVGFPSYSQANETIKLPNRGVGFSITGVDLDRAVAGVRYRRTARLKDGELTLEASARALQPEFPASEALGAKFGLRALRDGALWLRAPTDYTPSKQELAATSAVDPKTLEDYFKRANELMEKNDTDLAILDYDEVIRREPTMALALLDRGYAHVRKGDNARALADFDAALTQQPDMLAALYARADARLTASQPGLALRDADEAVRLAPNVTGPLDSRGLLFLRMGKPERAVNDFNASLKINPEGSLALGARARAYAALGKADLAKADLARIGESANLLNERCFARAVAGVALEEALSDCDGAVRLSPADPAFLDSRGFVQFRLGHMDKAIADLDAAIRLRPKLPESLYVRGLAKRRNGDLAGGDADIAAAKALDATVPRTYADYGVKP